MAILEWKDEETDVSKFLEQSGATGKSGVPTQLWEDTWDDDDVEEDFSVQLRRVLSTPGLTSHLTICREELAKATKTGDKANPDAMVS